VWKRTLRVFIPGQHGRFSPLRTIVAMVSRLARPTVPRLFALASLAVLVLAGVYLFQARQAHAHLTAAAARITELRQQITADADDAVVRSTAKAFQKDTSAARDAVHGPHWSLLAALPEVGPNVDAVQTVTQAADTLGAEALPQLIAASKGVDLEELAPVNGRVKLAPLQAVAAEIDTAHRAVSSASERVSGIDTEQLVAQLRAPVRDVADQLEEVTGLTGAAADAARLLPPMLGADGPRHYLLLTQNNAEPRALGGLPGAVLLLRAHEGRISLVEQRPAASFGDFGEPVLRLSPAERTLYGTQMGRYLGNVTSTPDFPRAAQLAAEMWRVGAGGEVDGVASIDPYALQLLLEATGSVTLPGGHALSGDNAAQTFLNQVYIDIPDPSAQDRFLAAAASAIFEKVMSGKGDLRAVAESLVEAVDQKRVMLWSANGDEQTIIAGTPLSGELRGHTEDAPVIGVYLHDRSSAKIAYYEKMDVDVVPKNCGSTGPRDMAVTVKLSSAVPGNIRQLPAPLTGGGRVVPVGHIRSDVLVYAPTGGVITGFRSDDGAQGMTTHFHDGLHVAARTVVLAPNEIVTMEYEIRSSGDFPEPVRVRTTPGPVPGQFQVSSSPCP
jgi:hypothetical protein